MSSLPEPRQPKAPEPPPEAPRRRRPAEGPEQERRQAWGREWGAITSEAATNARRENE